MKSAYELAMDRLAKSDPGANKPLTAEKKALLAEIDRVYTGKLAEREKKLIDLAAKGYREIAGMEFTSSQGFLFQEIQKSAIK